MKTLPRLSALVLAVALLATVAGCQSKIDSSEQKSVMQQKDTVSTTTTPNADTMASDTRR
jgi:uncharacterized lipoprotein